MSRAHFKAPLLSTRALRVFIRIVALFVAPPRIGLGQSFVVDASISTILMKIESKGALK